MNLTQKFQSYAHILGVLMVILAGAALRLVPHPPNFSPIAAMALFGGATLARRELGLLLPLAALFLSDLVIGFHDQMVAVYVSIALISGLGLLLNKQRTVGRVAMASVAGSLLFFLLTNFSVWMTSGMYSMTWDGLVSCYVAAVPFLQNSIAGDLVFTGAFFGVWALLSKAVPQLKFS